MNEAPANVDQYVAAFPGDVAARLTRLRQLVRELAPDASEGISYGMPTFKQGGTLIHFAAFKDHVGIYGAGGAAEAFRDELQGQVTTKGSIQFRHDRPFPDDLVRRIVEHRIEESLARLASKKVKPKAKSKS